MVLLVIIGLFVFTLAIGMPISFSIAVCAVGGILVGWTFPLTMVSIRMFQGVDSFPLMAIPFFVLAGEIMTRGQITQGLVHLSNLFVGRIRGGLAQSNVVVSMIFAGITGSATADTTCIGSILIPAMREEGYPADFSAAVTSASSIVGPIIPPSLVMVLYALAAGRISIAALFLAGYIPGLLVGLGLMIVAYIISRRRNYPKRTEKIPLKVMITVVKNSVLALLMPVIIIAGILSGAFTATEAAAVAVAYAFIVCFFVFRSLKFSELPAIFMNTAKISAVVFLLCATTNILSWILTLENVPQTLLGFFTSISSSPLMFLLFTNVILLFIGTFIDTVPAIFIMVPILKPVADMLGIHPLHFGVVVTLNLLIGLNTPPVGTCIFVASSIARISLEELVREIWPFLVVQIAVLLLITYIPDLVLFIPRLFGFA